LDQLQKLHISSPVSQESQDEWRARATICQRLSLLYGEMFVALLDFQSTAMQLLDDPSCAEVACICRRQQEPEQEVRLQPGSFGGYTISQVIYCGAENGGQGRRLDIWPKQSAPQRVRPSLGRSARGAAAGGQSICQDPREMGSDDGRLIQGANKPSVVEQFVQARVRMTFKVL
jgi:hypothetical protein